MNLISSSSVKGVLLALVLTVPLFAVQSASATILPLNNLYQEDNVREVNNIDKALFNRIVQYVDREFSQVVRDHGAVLKMVPDWDSNDVNAFATRHPGNIWEVHMFGALARRPEVTPDGFLLVACHELGHHLAGYPFYSGKDWAATEGAADYFATQVCARKLLQNQVQENYKYRFIAPDTVVFSCNMNWRKAEEQELCYRVGTAAMSLATLLSRLSGHPTDPDYKSRDQGMSIRTFEAHPDAQCRLDTYLAGALCDAPWDLNIIPGFDEKTQIGKNTAEAERDAYRHSCPQQSRFNPQKGIRTGARPLCWFKPQALPSASTRR